MPDMSMLDRTKLALRITEGDFDVQINDLIDAAKQDLGIAGVVSATELDSITRTAVITYVQMHFGEPDNYDRLKQSYDEQKAQLSTATGHTNWGE